MTRRQELLREALTAIRAARRNRLDGMMYTALIWQSWAASYRKLALMHGIETAPMERIIDE